MRTAIIALCIVLVVSAVSISFLILLKPDSKEALEPPYNRTWISPGKVEVSNYYPGGRVEWEFEVHNGNIEDIVDPKLITTEVNETSFPVKLKYPLYGSVEGIKIYSQSDEKPVAVSYNADTQELLLKDCLPNTTRQLDFKYPRMSEFLISTRLPDHAWEGYVPGPANYIEWVNISDRHPLLSPGENRKINVILMMPREVKIDMNKWEFWVCLTEGGPTGMITTEMVSRWLIKMKS